MEQKKEKTLASLSNDSLSVLCYQLSLLCRAGIPSADSIALLAADAQDPHDRTLLERLGAELDSGMPLSCALEQVGSFPAYFLNMISIGERSGRTDQVLGALADYYRREADTNRAIRHAVNYPAVMSVLVAVIFLVLMTRVLPVFRQVFAQLGMTVSGPAGGLLSMGDRGTYIAVALVVLLSVLALFLMGLFYLPQCAKLRHRLFNRGAAAKALSRSRFSGAMSLMLSSGLPLDEALNRTAQLLCDSPIAANILRCGVLMNEGTPFVKSLEAAGLLSGLACGLLSAGVQSGTTEEAMHEVSLRCQAEADDCLARLLARFEYGLIVLLCGGVGLVLLSVMLPLLGVLSTLGG